MYTLICSLDSPPGDGRTVPRMVSRTALREDLRNSDGHTDSPSGGTLKTAPRAQRSKLRPLYGVAHIRCHQSGRASPSRTSSCRNPDSLSALRNSFRGRERRSQIIAWHVYERARSEGDGSPNSSFYRPRQGVGWDVEIPKYPSFMSHMKGHNGNTRGAPRGHSHGSPTPCPPHGGAPPTSHQHVSMKHACSLDKKPPNMQPPIRGILSPRAETRCFPRNFFLKNSRRSQNISGTL